MLVLTLLGLGMISALMLAGPAWAGEAEARVLLEQAKVKFSAGQYADAAALLERVLQDLPEEAAAHSYLGLSRMAMGEFPQAVSAFEKVVSLDPDYPNGYANLAWARVEADDPMAALADAEQAVSKEPENGFAYYIRARAKLELDRCSEALEDLKTAKAKNPDLTQNAEFYAGVCYDKMGEKEQASAAFERAKEIDPRSAIGRQAESLLMEAVPGAPAVEKKDPMALAVRMLYQYDTNVVPVHEEDDLDLLDEDFDIDEEEDYRGVVSVDLVARPVQQERLAVIARYNLYANWHHEAEDMNLLNHLGQALLEYYGELDGMKTRSYLAGTVSSAYLNQGPYMWYYEVQPGLQIMETSQTMTHISPYFGKELYDEPKLGGLEDYDRNNDYYGVRVAQHFIWMEGHADLVIGGHYGVVDANGVNYDHIISGGLAGFAIQPTDSLLMIVRGRLEQREYGNSDWDDEDIIYPGTGERVARKDWYSYVSASLEYQLMEYLAAYLGVIYIDSESNVEPLDYERVIYTIGLTASTERVLPLYK